MDVGKSLIKGIWLKNAMAAAGVTAYQASKEMGKSPDMFYRHFNDKTHLSSESLARLHELYPRINLHYVLTGSGPALLTTNK